MKPSLSPLTRFLFLAAVYSASPMLLADDPKFTFNSFGQSISETFNDYRGSEESLPAGMSVLWAEGNTSEPFQGGRIQTASE